MSGLTSNEFVSFVPSDLQNGIEFFDISRQNFSSKTDKDEPLEREIYGVIFSSSISGVLIT